MYYANELTKQRHWCKVCYLFEAVTSQFDCGSRFQICDLHGSSFFSAIYTKLCSLKLIGFARYLQEKFTRGSDNTGTRTFADSDQG